MKDNNMHKKRAAIYFFYDKDGIADRFIEYFLNDLSKNVDYLLVVCNGSLDKKNKSILCQYGDVLERENKGFDVWAYKTGIEHIGWDNLLEFDELVMVNSTIYGPVYPFKETFDKMDVRNDIDFWGITEYFKQDIDPFNCISYGYIPDHIQSHFIAVRKSMFSSKDFREYWTNMPMINSYSEAVGKHEAIFTKKFSDLGFKWDLSLDFEDLRQYNGYPLMHCPKLLLEKYRCPIFKRRSFFHDTDDFLSQTTGEASVELFEYLKDNTDFDLGMMWDNLLRNYNQYDIFKSLHLMYTIPSNCLISSSNSYKVAVVYHVYFTDILDQTERYLRSVPSDYDVYITTDSKRKQKEINEYFKDYEFNKFEVRLIENRGRDVSSLLVGVKDVVMDYDLICFGHDKKTSQVAPETIGASFAYKCQENILKNKEYVKNVVATFVNNPRLGLLSPPEPNHSVFYPTIGKEWGPNFEITKKVADMIGIDVPMEEDKPPIAPLGTMFWFRPKAMKPLFDYDWDYDDFPKEPNKIDGTILHGIERLYPFVVQESGYYPAICMNDKFAAIEYNNLKHYIRGFNKTVFDVFEPSIYPQAIISTKKILHMFYVRQVFMRKCRTCLRLIITFPVKCFKKVLSLLSS